MAEPVAEEVASGDRRRALEALRGRLAAELDAAGHSPGCECECGPTGADGRIVATLTKELRETVRELDSLPGGQEVSTVDQLAARRKARLADAAGQ